MSNLNQYQILTQIRRTTGTNIRLGLLESVAAASITPTRISVSINRARVVSQRWKLQVTARGAEVHTWTLTASGWITAPATAVWWSTDEEHTSSTRQSDTEWERLCYRPGTPDFPLDNYERQAQGY